MRHFGPVLVMILVVGAFVTAVQSSPTWAGAVLVIAVVVVLIKYSTPKVG